MRSHWSKRRGAELGVGALPGRPPPPQSPLSRGAVRGERSGATPVMALLLEHEFKPLPADKQIETLPFLEAVAHLPPFFGLTPGLAALPGPRLHHGAVKPAVQPRWETFLPSHPWIPPRVGTRVGVRRGRPRGTVCPPQCQLLCGSPGRAGRGAACLQCWSGCSRTFCQGCVQQPGGLEVTGGAVVCGRAVPRTSSRV
nr:glycolipid transfer protein isoform X2 [Taeniopygia guttata]